MGPPSTFKTQRFYNNQDLCPECLKKVEAKERATTTSNEEGEWVGTKWVPYAKSDPDVRAVSKSDWRGGLALTGFGIGALIGILTRPSVFLIGQLPLQIVLTRGAGLSGMDEMLVPAAQSSFNYEFSGRWSAPWEDL